MSCFRLVSLWAVGLVWLAVGVACADTAEKKGAAKPEKGVSVETPEGNAKIVLTDEPVVDEPGSTIIPLKNIWGHGIGGTKSVSLAMQERIGSVGPKLNQEDHHGDFSWIQIHTALRRQEEEHQPIGSGFAVAGSGHEALVAVNEILEQNKKIPQNFPPGSEVSLFFFTRTLQESMYFKEVRQSSETVSIRYQFVPDLMPSIGKEVVSTSEFTLYFALIPLGKPAAGNYSVDVARAPVEKKYRKGYFPVSKEIDENFVCKSFTFMIESPATKTIINEK